MSLLSAALPLILQLVTERVQSISYQRHQPGNKTTTSANV